MSYQIGRKKNTTWKKRLLRNMVTELIMNGELKTTLPKAKELRRHAEKLITKARVDSVHNRRQAAAFLRPMKNEKGQTAVQVLFSDVAPKYIGRNGGYTRILKSEERKGDNAQIAIIKLV